MSDHSQSEQQVLAAMKDLSLSSASTSSGGIDGASLKKRLGATIAEINESASRNLGCLYRPIPINGSLNLPPEMLEAIFERISMQELLSKYRLVCSNWRDLIEDICRRKAKLCLFDCDSYLDAKEWLIRFGERLFSDIKLENIIVICFQHYQKSSYKKNVYKFVLRLFPRLTELMLRLWIDDSFSHLVIHLLSKWSPYLITFSVEIYGISARHGIIQMSNFINDCLPLRRLDLDLSAKDVNFCVKRIALSESTLKTLEHFSYGSDRSFFGDGRQLFESDSHCTRLWHRDCRKYTFHLAHMIIDWCQSHPTSLSKITHLRLDIHSDVVSHLSTHFTSLKVLSLCSIYRQSLNTKLFQALVPLTNLIELKLEDFEINNFLLPTDHIPLSSVKKLNFILDSYLSPFFQRRLSDVVKRNFYSKLAAYFPNLSELVVGKKSVHDDSIELENIEPFAALFSNLKKHTISN